MLRNLNDLAPGRSLEKLAEADPGLVSTDGFHVRTPGMEDSILIARIESPGTLHSGPEVYAAAFAIIALDVETSSSNVGTVIGAGEGLDSSLFLSFGPRSHTRVAPFKIPQVRNLRPM